MGSPLDICPNGERRGRPRRAWRLAARFSPFGAVDAADGRGHQRRGPDDDLAPRERKADGIATHAPCGSGLGCARSASAPRPVALISRREYASDSHTAAEGAFRTYGLRAFAGYQAVDVAASVMPWD